MKPINCFTLKCIRCAVKYVALTAPLLLFQVLTAQDRFSRNEVLTDMEYLVRSLEASHFDLYAYTPKPDFLANYKAVRESVTKDSLNQLEATSLLQRVISKADIGHTSIDYPIQVYADYVYSGGTLFPLELAFEGDRALVRKNWSAEEEIIPGSELLRIDGTPIGEILAKIYPLISAERPYFKKTKIEMYAFPRYYWQAFGAQETFEVAIRTGGQVKTFTLEAIRALEDFELRRSDIIQPEMQLKFLQDAAYLNPGGFGGDEKAFRRSIDSAFAEIKARQSPNLILDLRNNPGGDDAFSNYLVSYIADKPFSWNASYQLRTSDLLKEHIRNVRDTTVRFWQEALRRNSGETYTYPFEPLEPQPRDKRFPGRVYVLINRQSHSQSAVTAAQIQDYGFGTLVGEETAEYPSLYASIFQYKLPNTGISVNVSKGYMVRVSGNETQQGVLPDIRIEDHLLDETDEILQGVLEIIRGAN